MKTMQRFPTSVAIAFAFMALAASSPRGNADVAFEFETNGVLPSAQGATYGGSLTESSVFSATNGVLHQDTTASSDQSAYYVVTGAFDHSVPTSLEWSCRVLGVSGGTQGQEVALAGGGAFWDFIIEPTGLRSYDDACGCFKPRAAMDTTDALHTYRVDIPANQSTFDLFIDGFLKASGLQAANVERPNLLLWGDITGSGGNGAVDWGFVRLSGPPVCSRPVVSIFLSAAEICWCSQSNTLYQVQWAGSPDSTNWMNFGAALQGTGTNMCVFDSTRGRDKRFYRVEALP